MLVNGRTVNLMLLTYSVHAITSVLHNNSLRLSLSSSTSPSLRSSSSSFPFYRQLFSTVWLFTASHFAQNAATECINDIRVDRIHTSVASFSSRRQFERYYTIMAITRSRYVPLFVHRVCATPQFPDCDDTEIDGKCKYPWECETANELYTFHSNFYANARVTITHYFIEPKASHACNNSFFGSSFSALCPKRRAKRIKKYVDNETKLGYRNRSGRNMRIQPIHIANTKMLCQFQMTWFGGINESFRAPNNKNRFNSRSCLFARMRRMR